MRWNSKGDEFKYENRIVKEKDGLNVMRYRLMWKTMGEAIVSCIGAREDYGRMCEYRNIESGEVVGVIKNLTCEKA